jgi:lysophospholipase L1-like esterase
MKKIFKVFACALLAVLLVAVTVVPALAANTPGKIDYAAFGDSVAAGVRGGVGAPGSELGSDKGYTDDIAAMLEEAGVLGSFNEDFCTSGMTAALLAENTAVLTDGTTEAAKMVADAEIVTLDIGANDLLAPLYEYIASLTSIADVKADEAKAVLESMVEDLTTGTTGTDAQANIETILQNILDANASVKIFVMGYYNPLPVVSTLYGVDLDEPTGYFNTYIQAAISNTLEENPDASIAYVPTFDAMAAASGSLAPTDIHPTEAGYMVIAEEFWKQIEPLVSYYISDAVPSTSPIVVGGIQVPFEAYNVNGNNYVRLRDVAMAINGTDKQVSISYDEATKAVAITTGEPYIPNGSELAGAGNAVASTAYLSVSEFYIDGVAVSLTAYNINGSNYIKLRDIALALDFGLDYDEETNTVTVDLTKGYTPPEA